VSQYKSTSILHPIFTGFGCQYVDFRWTQFSVFPRTTNSSGLLPLFTPHSDNTQLPSMIAIWGIENTTIIKLSYCKHLSLTSWIVWCEHMIIMLKICKVYEYTQGLVQKLDSLMDPQGARNWAKNDNYAKHPTSAPPMWKNESSMKGDRRWLST
jgi:hypothetical protein